MVREPDKPTPLENVTGTEEVVMTEPPKLNVIPKILTLIKSFTSFPKPAVQNAENKSPIRPHPFLRTYSRDSMTTPTSSAPTSQVHDVTFTSQGTYFFFRKGHLQHGSLLLLPNPPPALDWVFLTRCTEI